MRPHASEVMASRRAVRMETPNHKERKGRRKGRRKKKRPQKYEPTVVIRDRSTGNKKRSRRRGPKRSQKKLTFSATRCSSDVEDLPFLDSNTDSSASEDEEEVLNKPVQNVSTELRKLMQVALQVEKDFPNDVKIEMPRYRCLKCNQHFQLESYRKVCINYINKSTVCQIFPVCLCDRKILRLTCRKISGNKRVHCCNGLKPARRRQQSF